MWEGSYFVKSMIYLPVVTYAGGPDWQGKGHGEDSGAEL